MIREKEITHIHRHFLPSLSKHGKGSLDKRRQGATHSPRYIPPSLALNTQYVTCRKSWNSLLGQIKSLKRSISRAIRFGDTTYGLTVIPYKHYPCGQPHIPPLFNGRNPTHDDLESRMHMKIVQVIHDGVPISDEVLECETRALRAKSHFKGILTCRPSDGQKGAKMKQ
jgi:hypothetical protein